MIKLYKGDNLDVMKELIKKKAKFNLVYLDPPYNTKNQCLSYDDSYEGTTWKSFFKKRVRKVLALLDKDSVVFTSIGHEELASCLNILDEVFGKETRKLVMPRLSCNSRKTTNTISKMHDFLIVNVFGKVEFNGSELSNKTSYKLQDKHFQKRGLYQIRPLDSNEFKYAPSLDFSISLEGNTYYPNSYDAWLKRSSDKKNNASQTNEWCWRWSKSRVNFAIKNDFIVIKGSRIFKKTYENCRITSSKGKQSILFKPAEKKFSSVELVSPKYLKSKAENFSQKFFKYSKPISFVDFIVSLPKFSKVHALDPFAGSGITAVSSFRKDFECTLIQAPHPLRNKNDLYNTNSINTVYDLTVLILKSYGIVFKEIDFSESFYKRVVSKNKEFVPFRQDKLNNLKRA